MQWGERFKKLYIDVENNIFTLNDEKLGKDVSVLEVRFEGGFWSVKTQNDVGKWSMETAAKGNAPVDTSASTTLDKLIKKAIEHERNSEYDVKSIIPFDLLETKSKKT